MPEGVWGIQNVQATPQPLGVRCAEEQVPHKGLARGDQFVSEHVPRPNGEAPRAHQSRHSLAAVGAHAQVVLEQDRLSIEEERAVRRICFEPGHEVVECGHEAGEERGVRQVPLAVPVCVGDQVKHERAHVDRSRRIGGSASLGMWQEAI